MWTSTASIGPTASPQALWRLFEDVAAWTDWNGGIERIARRDVRPDAGFVDETVLDGTRFLVSHELHPLPSGGTRVTYSIQVEGPEAATLGPLVSADFPEVLAALKALAERDRAGEP